MFSSGRGGGGGDRTSIKIPKNKKQNWGGGGVGVMSFCERKINSGTQEMKVSLKFTGEILMRRYHV